MINMREVIEKYSILQDLSPKNKLLEYIIVDGKTSCLNTDEKIYLKFLKNFDGFPKFEHVEKVISYDEYCDKKLLFLMTNYEEALDKEIIKLQLGVKI